MPIAGLIALAAALPAPIPPVPVTPAPSFAAQVSGRAALSDALFALSAAPKQSYTATWRFAAFDETGKAQSDFGGRETVSLDRAGGKVSFVATSAEGKAATRYVANGETLLFARLDAGKRTWSHLSQAGGAASLRNVLLDADADKMFQTATTRTALFGTPGDDSIRFGGTVFTDKDGAIIEQLPTQEENGHAKRVYRRYRLQAKTGKMASREEWATWQDAGKPVLLRSYWRETVTHTAPKFSALTFSVKPAPDYEEVAPPPSKPAPIPPGPDTCDARARPLLTRWIRATSRMVSLDSRWYVSQGLQAQTPESVPVPTEPEREAMYDLLWQRPGRLRLLMTPTAAKRRETPNLLTETLLAVADGYKVAIFGGELLTKKRGEFSISNGSNAQTDSSTGFRQGFTDAPSASVTGDDNALGYALFRAGAYDYTQMLAFVLWNPQVFLDNAESATYRGTLALPGGGTAEAITLSVRHSETGERRKGRPGSDVTNQIHTITLFFDAATGLPRRLEQTRRYFPTDGKTLLRDTRPNETFAANTDRLLINRELSAALFVLPQERVEYFFFKPGTNAR
ncbi:MAG: hypothetical protein H7Y38_01495 [Armatimonadetes bacterium]|nr:hypothetical protein [Armatimonadota bacterium]